VKITFAAKVKNTQRGLATERDTVSTEKQIVSGHDSGGRILAVSVWYDFGGAARTGLFL
jgi:hypothetical protein